MVIIVAGDVRIRRLRYQDLSPRGGGAVATCDRLDEGGRAVKCLALRFPGCLIEAGRPFHRGQMIAFKGNLEVWRDPRTELNEEQINVTEWHQIRPRGAGWIDYVAGNPAFPGIGRAIAERIWNLHGPDVYRLLDARDVDALSTKIRGLSHGMARSLVEGWAACGHERLVGWLDAHRAPRRLCVALLKAYQNQDGAVDRLDADPFRLLAFGLPWDRVDDIARNGCGIGAEDPRRLHAAVVECLTREYRRGHTAATASTLTAAVAETLAVDAAAAAAALRLVFADGGFVRAAPDLFQLRGVHVMESAIAKEIARRCDFAGQGSLSLDNKVAIDEFEAVGEKGVLLTAEQRRAVVNGALLPFSVLVGGAGTGKTACLAALHHLVRRLNGHPDGVLQMALAGRAAKRMREATGREAVTIAGFLHTMKEKRLRTITHVVIDEASMLDVPSFYAVLRRLRGRASIMLVGDDFQLPPIGGGKILHLLAHRDDVPVVVLGRVWRQEEGSSIRTVATAIRSGATPTVSAYDGIGDGVFLIAPGRNLPETVRMVFEEIGGSTPDSDVCVLAPRRRSGFGNALEINRAIHRRHFSRGRPVATDGPSGHVDTGFCIGDRFVCDVNHWDVDLMNGSLGRILRLATPDEVEAADRERQERGGSASGRPLAIAEIDGEVRLLEEHHLLDCSWGYALTCHRAQGSDFSRVVVVLDDRADRSWLYTAITRARRQVVLVGTPEQVALIAAAEPRVDGRRVGLDALLNKQMPPLAGKAYDQLAA